MTIGQRTAFVKRVAKELGFISCGVAKAQFLEEEAPRLEQWLRESRQGEMRYMENHFDKRLDPTLLVPGAKSVVSLTYNYFPGQLQIHDAPQISKYAYGEDYHLVLKEKLLELLDRIREEIGEVDGRCFVDSAPVLDKVWAARSGLGWIGKHSNLLSKSIGSYFFIAELIIDLDLEHDAPVMDHCGDCTRCVDACPTEAIYEPYKVDGSKCISYFTIELKGAIDETMKGQFENWAFGCDICQDVCPWNRFSTPHDEPRFEIPDSWSKWKTEEWKELTEEVFNKVFERSPIQRAGFSGLKRNVRFLESSDQS
ncbi:MAG: tRNA epoxyqueuosine(34) reductase QueG [Bacteroidetes bacterium]|nr:tRNA epoxyqueuosine(34) reductase QueG [Bacteroidota bacterium]